MRTAFAALALAVLPAWALAAGPFTVSGTVDGSPVSGQATFSVLPDGTGMTITLQNTTAGGTPQASAILTGLIWNWSANAAPTQIGVLDTAPNSVVASTLWERDSQHSPWGQTGTDVDITAIVPSEGTDKSWAHAVAGTTPALFDFGLGAVGANIGWAGGAKLNGDDYGIVAIGTNFAGPGGGFSASKSPLAMDTVTFRLTGFLGLTDASIESVSLFWGSDAYLTPGEPGSGGSGILVPEASSLMMLAFGGLPIGLAGLKMRRRR